MKFVVSSILFVVLSTTYAAPPIEPGTSSQLEERAIAPDNTASISPQANVRAVAPANPQADVRAVLAKALLEPIKAEARSMVGDLSVAAKDMGKALQESSNNILQAGRAAFAPGQERANLGLRDRIEEIGRSVQANARSLTERLIADTKPIAVKERAAGLAAAGTLRQVIGVAENRLLTPQGQNLVRALSRGLLR